MATTPTNSNVNISDIPEEIKPFRQALLNAITALTFDPRYIAQQFSGQNIPQGGTQNPGGTVGDPNYNATATGVTYGTPVSNKSGFQVNQDALSGLMKQLSKAGATFSPDLMNTKSGGIEALSGSALSTKGVNLNDVGKPIGQGTYPVNQPVGGGVTNPIVIGSNGMNQPGFNPYLNYQTPPPITNPNGNNNNPGTNNPGTNNPGTNNPGGGNNPNTPNTPNNPQNPGGGTTYKPVGTVFTAPGAAGTTTVGSDYNPNQYASDALAQQLAAALGANVTHTLTGGPNGPPPQNLLDFGIGGVGNMLNAGLVNNMLTAPSQQPFAQQRLQDELNYLSGNSAAYQGFNVPPQTYSQYAVDVSKFPKIGGMASGGSLMERLQKKRYARGGSVKRYVTGGITGLDPSASTTSTTSSNSNYPFADYQPYGGQRLLDWRENAPSGNLQISNATRQAEAGMANNIPSMYDEEGGIGQGPLRFANDGMDWAGRNIGNAMEGYNDIMGRASSIGQTSFSPLQYSTSSISDPELLSAGRISVDPLNNYQMQNPLSWTDQGVRGAYMNPYQDAVTSVQRQRAIDDFNEQRGARNSSAVASGAFGGSRQAVENGVAQRALNRNLQNIDAQGLNNAYLNAQQQFGADRTAATGVNKANLDALLQTQGLATQAGLSAAQSNQATNAQQFNQLLQAQQNAEQMRNQFGLQSQQLQDSSNQAAARLGLDAAQLGGNLGISAMQGLTSAGTALSNNAATRADLQRLAQQLEQGRLGTMQQAGAAQDARMQGALNLGYQDFQNQRNYPFQLANFYQGQLSGIPVGVNQEQIQYQQYSPFSQIGGAITSGIGALGQYAANRSNG